MKKALVVLLAACMLGVSVGCGSQSPSGSGAQPSTTTSASSESVTDKIDFHGVHLQLPAPAEVINDEENDSAYSVGEDIQVNVNLADTTELDVVANGREYAPEIALFYYSDAFEGGDTESRETDHVMIDGTFALVERFPGDSDNATVILILDSEVVRIELYGNADAIQQVIDAIEIDDECIPECAKKVAPEALKEAGLREQAWLAQDIVYMNVPEGYKLIDLDDGTQIWADRTAGRTSPFRKTTRRWCMPRKTLSRAPCRQSPTSLSSAGTAVA